MMKSRTNIIKTKKIKITYYKLMNDETYNVI